MHKSYNISAKKSIFLAISVFFLLGLCRSALAFAPNDEKYKMQSLFWEQIGAEKAWDIKTETEAIVAIIDIGIDYDHPDLKQNIWTNNDEIPGNNLDDDSNGYVDDVHGWNFVESNDSPKVLPQSGFNDNYTLSHGTAIAGLIGAIGNNNQGITGLNWKVRIMPIRAINSYGIGKYEDIVRAVKYALKNGADVISMSFIGDVEDEELYNVLRTAYQMGVVTVVAAGNDKQSGFGDLDEWPLYPICFDDNTSANWLLGVTSVGANDQLSSFANYGTYVDISAPGEDLYSTEMQTASNDYSGYGGGWQGTSFSTPFVAGAVAMIKGIRPDWTADQLISQLLRTADPIDYLNTEFTGKIGSGRLNVYRALMEARAGSLAGITDRVCFSIGTRIYCYDISSRARLYLTNAGNSIKDLDWQESTYVAAILSGEKVDSAIILSGKGNLIRSIRLNSKYSKISLFNNAEKTNFIVAGYDLVNGHTFFSQYDLNGKIINSFFLNGDWRNFKAVSDQIYASSLSGGKIVLAVYDLQGKKLNYFIGPKATAIDNIAVGHLWSKDSLEVALIGRDVLKNFLLIANIESSSFLKESLFLRPQGLNIYNSNAGSTENLLLYGYNGGKFDILSGKSKKVGSVDLPALK